APTAGAFAIANHIAWRREATYSDLWRDGFAHFGPAVRLQYLQLGVIAILVSAILFYARLPIWPARVAVSLSAYALLVWLMMLLTQWPLLLLQEKGVLDEPD